MGAEWGGGDGSALAPGPQTRGHRTALAYADRLPPWHQAATGSHVSETSGMLSTLAQETAALV